jgi:hypothetical protein
LKSSNFKLFKLEKNQIPKNSEKPNHQTEKPVKNRETQTSEKSIKKLRPKSPR